MRRTILASFLASFLVTTGALAAPTAPSTPPAAAVKPPAPRTEKPAAPAKPLPVAREIDPKAAPLAEVKNLRDGVLKEATGLKQQADALVGPRLPGGAYRQDPPKLEAYVEASALYMSAARAMVTRSSELSARLSRESPDHEAKAQATSEMVADLRKGASLYRDAARAENARAGRLMRIDMRAHHEEIGHIFTRAQGMTTSAQKLEIRANEIAESGLPALPQTITLAK